LLLRTAILAISLCLCVLGGCAGTKIPCAQDLSAYPEVTEPWLPVSPVHLRIAAGIRKGLWNVETEGDIVFIPPDTLRMQLHTDWGETVFDLRISGPSVCMFMVGTVPPDTCFTENRRLFSTRTLLALLAGRPGISSFLNPAAVRPRCAGSTLEFFLDGLRVVVDRKKGAVSHVEHDQMAFSYDVISFAETDHVITPRHYRFSPGNGATVDITVIERTSGTARSGRALLN